MTVSSDLHRSSKSSLDSLLLHKTDWRSIYFITSIAMMDTMRLSTVLSNSWPYISSIDPDTSENFYGFVSSIPPIMAGQIIAIIATLLFANLELILYNRRYGFFVCHLLLGFANG
uniref:7TM_GPCR_Srx domain-containing protein n=1 Tax=Meloidogyne hapla TaxID=6305 RepID=A0A1I8AXL3_MELHA